MTLFVRQNRQLNWREEQAGFTFLELTVVIVVISILFLFAYQRYLDLLVDVEKASVAQTLGILRSATGMKVAKLIVDGKIGALPDYEGSNPVKLLAEVPENYRGETANPLVFREQDGIWFFDTKAGLLVYQVKNREAFFSEMEGSNQARFRMQLVYEDNNRNGRFERAIDDLAGLRLRPVDNYSWLEKIKK